MSTNKIDPVAVLREALDIALNLANAEVENLKACYGDRLQNRHKRAADDVVTIKDAIAKIAATEHASTVAKDTAGEAQESISAFGDWLNEPRSTEETTEVRDYRFEAYRRWRDAVGAHKKPNASAATQPAGDGVSEESVQRVLKYAMGRMSEVDSTQQVRDAFDAAFLSANGHHTQEELTSEWEYPALSGIMFRSGVEASRRLAAPISEDTGNRVDLTWLGNAFQGEPPPGAKDWHDWVRLVGLTGVIGGVMIQRLNSCDAAPFKILCQYLLNGGWIDCTEEETVGRGCVRRLHLDPSGPSWTPKGAES